MGLQGRSLQEQPTSGPKRRLAPETSDSVRNSSHYGGQRFYWKQSRRKAIVAELSRACIRQSRNWKYTFLAAETSSFGVPFRRYFEYDRSFHRRARCCGNLSSWRRQQGEAIFDRSG